jgi:hypothetical protein
VFWAQLRKWHFFSLNAQPLKGLSGIISAMASLYLSVVPSVIYVCVYGRLNVRIALRYQRARASSTWSLSTSLRIFEFAHDVTELA